MKHLLPNSGNGHGPRLCDLAGCGNTTREGKPFCPDHVDHHPYVRQLLQELADKDTADDLVKKNGASAVSVQSLTAQELLLHLSLHGTRTVERLSREMQLEAGIICSYADRLEQEGLVETSRTARGSTTVRLVQE